MLNKIVRFLTLTVICAVIFSCGTDAKSYLKDQMVNTLTDTAINSAKTSAGGTTSKKSGFFGGDSGDAHFFEDDYLLIATEQYKSGWIRVITGKMVEPASKATKGEAKLMYISNGDEVWSKYFYNTRVATKSDLKVGKILFASDVNNEDGVYMGPENKSDTYDSWFMTKITDMSDIHKGYVTVAGNYKVSINALRVEVKVK